MKKMIKILPMLMTVLMLLTVCTPVLATGTNIAGVTVNPSTNSSNTVAGIGNNILGIIRVVGTVIAVGVLMVIGIKYMMGSAEEKAEYKQSMWPYVLGAILIFAGAALTDIIYKAFN